MLRFLLLAAWIQPAISAALTASTAGNTLQPLVPRDITTAGYNLKSISSGTPIFDPAPVTYNLQNQIVATSGNLFRICSTASACNFFTCSGNYAVFSTTSVYCGTSSGLTCSSDVSYTNYYDTKPLTNYWCDSKALTGFKIYKVTTTSGSSTPTSSSPSPGRSSTPITSTSSPARSSTPTTSTPSSRSSPVTTSTPTIPGITPKSSPTTSNIFGSLTTGPTPESTKSPVPVGAIAGGVVGGVAVLAAIIFGAIFLVRRKQNPQPQAPAAAAAPPAHYPDQGPGVPMVPMYQPQEKPYAAPPPEAAPQYSYNDYPSPVSSPPPQFAPQPQLRGPVNELPSSNV